MKKGLAALGVILTTLGAPDTSKAGVVEDDNISNIESELELALSPLPSDVYMDSVMGRLGLLIGTKYRYDFVALLVKTGLISFPNSTTFKNGCDGFQEYKELCLSYNNFYESEPRQNKKLEKFLLKYAGQIRNNSENINNIISDYRQLLDNFYKKVDNKEFKYEDIAKQIDQDPAVISKVEQLKGYLIK